MEKEKYTDLGFGTKTSLQSSRLLTQDGSFTVERRGISKFDSFSWYHHLINISLPRFLFIMLCGYVLMNAAFALIYLGIGIEKLNIVCNDSLVEKFFEAFFFSTQTFTTVGYGRINPNGFAANAVAAFESFIGLLAFALATGLLYGRFARPKSNILFSKNALIAPYEPTGKALMFRIANRISHVLIDVEAQITMAYLDRTSSVNRRFVFLPLERTKINLLPTMWTIVHPIDAESPFYNKTKAEIDAMDIELIVMLKAFDDTFSQTVHSRFSYKHDEIIWNAKFVQAMNYADNEHPYIELDKLGVYDLL